VPVLPLLFLLLFGPSPAAAQAGTGGVAPIPLRRPDVLFQPTPMEVVRQMLDAAHVGRDDVVYDLGSGDGRIVLTAAAERGARGVGIDIDPELVKDANDEARRRGVADRVRFLHQDLFEADFHDATVVTLYLLPALNLKLRPRLLAELKPGTRIVSYAWHMGDWPPEQTIDTGGINIYVWRIPPRR
jgi:hypothetical protein